MFAMGIITITLPFGAFFSNAGGGTGVTVTQVAQPVTQVTQPLAPNSAASSNTSLNWSGYVASNGTFTSVTGTWIVPTVSSTDATAADATWVGIGGAESQTLIQAGTQAVVNNSGGISYEAWYETLPQATQPISLGVAPGDSITATVSETSPNEWAISVTDNTTDKSFETNVQYDASLSSAEWIEEMPTDGTNLIPLDNFGTVSFINGATVQNGTSATIAQSGAQPITMINQADQTLASPSALGAGGESFIVTRGNAAPSQTGRGYYTSISPGRPWRRTGVGLQGYATGTPRSYVRTGIGRQSQGQWQGQQQQIFRILQQMQAQMMSQFSFVRLQ